MVHSQFESCIDVVTRRGSLNVGYEFEMNEKSLIDQTFSRHMIA